MHKKFYLFFIVWFIFIGEARSQNFIKNFTSASAFAAFGNGMLFAGDDGVHGLELWKTDGTVQGTAMVKDIYPGGTITPSPITAITVYNGKAYFAALDAKDGSQLWQSDGTANGTVMVKNLGALSTGYGAEPRLLTICNGLLYFVQTSDGITSSLWKTDGTANGTVQITGNDYTNILQLISVGNKLYFAKYNYPGIWQSDGTTAGTVEINVDSNQIVGMLTNVNNNLVFITDENYYNQNVNLYALSPATGSPVLLQSFNPGTYNTSTIDNITAVGTNFFFSIRTSGTGENGTDALWTSDCTTAGTKTVASYSWEPYLAYDYMRNFINFNNKLYFAATSSASLYTSDGTAAGTVQVAAASQTYGVNPVVSNGKLYFAGNSLWSYDGINAKQEIQNPANPASLFDDNGRLYFTTGATYSSALWNNVPAGQLQVTMNYQNLTNGGALAINSKADSVVTNQVNVTNTGNNTLVFSEIGIYGDSFYVNGTPAQTLPPGGQATFNVLYSPLKTEQVSALLSIKCNDQSGTTEFSYNFTGAASGTVTKILPPPANGFEKEIVFPAGADSFTLSNNSIAESSPVNTAIGTFQLTNTTGYQYQLVAGDGSADNSNFTIVNGTLQSAAVFNFSVRNTYSIRVQASNGTTSVQKIFAVQVTNTQVNLAPACAEFFQDLTYSLNDVTYTGSRIVAVGTAATILNSDDNGQTWTKINSGAVTDFERVQFTDSKTGYILGQSPPMLKTEDGGNTWFPLAWPPQPQYAASLTNMYFVSNLVGYVITGNNAYNPCAIFKTTDGGHTWNQLSYTSYLSSFYGVCFTDANTGFICGSSGLLIRTTDGGNTWQPIAVPAVGANTPFNNITFMSSLVGYMTSSAGDVLQTKDGGNTWARISTLTANGDIANRIYFHDANNGYALGNSAGYLYTTTDGGHTWSTQTINGGSSFRALAFNSAATNFCLIGYLNQYGPVSQQGSTIYTSNSGNTWTTQSYFSDGDYVGGNLFADGTGYVFGASSLKTTDGGITWKPLNISVPYPEALTQGVFLNASTGFYTDYHDVYKTVDGGNTWVLKNTDQTTPISTPITFYNTSLGFYANSETLYRTTDGGETWSPLSIPNSEYLRNISFGDQNTVYITGIGLPLYKSTDGGNTWTSSSFGNYQYQFIFSLHFFDALNGLAGGTSGLLLRTTDGGQTWAPVTNSIQLDIMALQFIDKLHGYAYTAYDEGQGGTEIFETTDGGNNWTEVYRPDNGFRGFQLNDGQLFMSGPSGSMVKLNSSGPLPGNAGYIAGDIAVASGVKTVYSVPALQNTYYTWTATGAQSVEYHNNQITVSWQKGGNYALQVTPYNNCSNGQSRAVNVNVEDIPAPQLTGADTVINYATNVAYNTPTSTNTFSWAATGDISITPSSNQATVNWGKPGNGTVTVVVTNSDLDMEKSSTLNVAIQQVTVTLPDSNFSVSVTSSSCIGSNNGSIGIMAQQPLSYTATVTGPGGFSQNLSFTDSLTVGSLDTGAYNVCIGISGNSIFQRCYSVSVTEPKALSAYAVVNQSSRNVTIDLSGANTYYINLNGKIAQTNANQVNIPLNNGRNQLEIYTDKLCQGVIQKIVDLNVISVYPVPFTNTLNIDLGGSQEPTATITINDALGKMVYNKEVVNNGGKLQVDVSNFMIGTYVLKLDLGSSSTIFKVLKQ